MAQFDVYRNHSKVINIEAHRTEMVDALDFLVNGF